MQDDHHSPLGMSRRSLLAAGSVAAASAIGGTAAGSLTARQNRQAGSSSNGSEQELVVRQAPGNAFYWVLPGPRRLSPQVFGTPDNPLFGTAVLQSRIEAAKSLPEPLDDAVPQLLEDLPVLVAAPEAGREPVEADDAIAQEVFASPTLYSDNAEVTSGRFEITYRDSRPYDLPGAPGDTPDAVELSNSFTDPAGNEYAIEFDHVVQPPIPDYETGGGVMIDARHHGTTGTGSPLMPEVYNYGAMWGIGHLRVNGEVVDENKVIHFMTTQVVRDERYTLVLGEQLPLAPQNTIAGRVHHTHGIVLPVTATPDGPVFEPVNTAFELPNGETQPFVHAMWEQDEIVSGPFADWSWPGAEGTPTPAATPDGTPAGNGTTTPQQTAANGDVDVRLAGVAQGWEGLVPASIEGQTNPTLTLQTDTEYTLVWENRDGLKHNFAVQNADGEDLLASDLLGDEGTTQTVTFTATDQMSEYYCQVHPNSMRGTIEVQS